MSTSATDLQSKGLLAGKRVIITGAASGIGLEAARVFASYGATLFLADLDEEGVAATAAAVGAKGSARVDVSDESSCEQLAYAAAEALGGIDGGFNSAGISDPVKPALELRLEDWQRVVDVNLRGTFLFARSLGRSMVEAGGGALVTVSSVNGINGIPRRHAYGPAKAAIAQLTRTLACEWGRHGVRVNSLAPTYIKTPMIDRLEAEGKIDVDRLRRRTPMRRLGEPAEVADAAAFLLSDLSRFVTGTVLPVDGGWLAYGGPGDVETA